MIWAVMALSRGGLEPKDYQYKEYWTWKPAGEKPWIVRVFSKGRFWEDERRRQQHQQQLSGDAAKQHHEDEFAMSEADLDSTRTSHVGTSFAASTHRASAMPSEGGQHHQHHHREGSAGEAHEMDVVVPQQVSGVARYK